MSGAPPSVRHNSVFPKKMMLMMLVDLSLAYSPPASVAGPLCSIAASGTCPALALGDRVLAIDEDKKYHDGKVQGMINNNSGISIDFSDWSPTERWWTPGFEGALPFVPVKEPTIGLLVIAQVPNQDYWEQATISAPGGSTEEWIVRFNDGTTVTKANHDLCSVCSPSAEHPQIDGCASEPVGSCDSLVPGDKVLVAEKLGYLGCYKDDDGGARDLDHVVCGSGVVHMPKGGCSDLSMDYMDKDSLTIEKCAQWCSSFKYFGVEFGYNCFCGNSYGSQGKANDGDCDTACTGDSTQICGAGYHNSVYSTATTTWSSAQVLGLTSSNTLYISGDDVAFASVPVGYTAQHKGLVKEVVPAVASALGTTVLAKQDGADGYSMGKVVGSDGTILSVLFEQGLNNVGKVKAADVRLLCYAFE